mmetsp:Transcript_5040/g.7114  ORF Transcript_5040/g.7114 Transcript_5040/m.7114 type:complete len:165 (-) Transcript_5040:137-631(-)
MDFKSERQPMGIGAGRRRQVEAGTEVGVDLKTKGETEAKAGREFRQSEGKVMEASVRQQESKITQAALSIEKFSRIIRGIKEKWTDTEEKAYMFINTRGSAKSLGITVANIQALIRRMRELTKEPELPVEIKLIADYEVACWNAREICSVFSNGAASGSLMCIN